MDIATDTPSSHLELWAGAESTLNRVGERYFDQLKRSGHLDRLDDLDRFAELGIRALRQPVLWERVAPAYADAFEWSWSDAWLARLRQLGIRPIVGLLHHGSGPRYTDLLDPEFPVKLAAYARAVAERYPWVQEWTPVNEPLTTARFSALYGHWYPHRRDPRSFLRALVNQCKGTALAMREIRSVNPNARFVSTEDMGLTFSTPHLEYQARFENERRWASLDLLAGRLDRRTDFARWVAANGVSEPELDWFTEHPCVPDIIGLNHYPTSQRYLDERLDDYPSWSHGGNAREAYADVEAVRARGAGIATIAELLTQAATRYERPVAVTECHIWSTREQQMRWLADTWSAAADLRAGGVDVRAVTVWALLGTFDWDRLVTEEGRHYENGAFDVRGGTPRPTAIASLARDLARGVAPSHRPALIGPRWWRAPARILFGRERQLHEDDVPVGPPILVVGGQGTLGSAFARLATARGLHALALGRRDIDITDADSIATAIARLRPWAIVNAAGYVRVDEAEHDERCERENADGALLLAQASRANNVKLLTFSSDLVFDGSKRTPYLESDAPRPLSAYGRSKTHAERYVRENDPHALIIRTSSFFGPWDEANFVVSTLRSVTAGRPVRAADDIVVSPTYVPDLVNECLDLLIDDETGLWHVAGPDAVTWAELARRATDIAGLGTTLVEGCRADSLGWAASRPRYSVLGSERAVLLPTLDDALARFMASAADLLRVEEKAAA
jgi:dTDP-4-dehydrorhamnose reductase